MRALIRAQIVPSESDWPARNQRDQYDKKIIEIFEAMGFNQRYSQFSKSADKSNGIDVGNYENYLFADTPKDISFEEMKHVVMFGYTSDGQAKFVVCSINKHELHIRVRDDLFDKLRRACSEICRKAKDTKALQKKCGGYIVIDKPIEVIEPGHSHATIIGKIVHSPMKTVLRQERIESLTAAISLILALILFFYSNQIVDWLEISFNVVNESNKEYFRGALDRVDTALLVTFVVTAIHITMKWLDLFRYKPIVWNEAIEATRVSS